MFHFTIDFDVFEVVHFFHLLPNLSLLAKATRFWEKISCYLQNLWCNQKQSKNSPNASGMYHHILHLGSWDLSFYGDPTSSDFSIFILICPTFQNISLLWMLAICLHIENAEIWHVSVNQMKRYAPIRQFKKLNVKKTAGPDSGNHLVLHFFYRHVQLVTRAEYCSTMLQDIISAPQKSKITGLNDYRPVAYFVCLDLLQFAYRSNRSLDDEDKIGLHFVLTFQTHMLGFSL